MGLGVGKGKKGENKRFLTKEKHNDYVMKKSSSKESKEKKEGDKFKEKQRTKKKMKGRK